MADWRLLGEVPDSEDDLDSQETDRFSSPPPLPQAEATPRAENETQPPADIWDVPDSSPLSEIHESLFDDRPITPTPADDILQDDENPLSAYGRALRPRKPIQEHPYMLENARYSSAVRSAGFKPVRMGSAKESQEARHPDEDSQDKEFQEESQSTAASQVVNLVLEAGGIADQPPASSFPSLFSTPRGHRESSLKLLGFASSPPSRARETDATSPVTAEVDESNNNNDDNDNKSKTNNRDNDAARVEQVVSELDGGGDLDLDNDGFPSLDFSPSLNRRHSLGRPHQSPLRTRIALDLSSSEDDVDIVRFSRRARGVLPASHFRLDQPNNAKPRQNAQTRLPDMTDEPVQKRGVAIRRQGVSGTQPASRFALVGLDESDSEVEEVAHTPVPPRATRELSLTQTVLHVEVDDGSAAEDNDIDHMVQRTKRPLDRSRSDTTATKRRKVQKSSSRTGVRGDQTSITSHFLSKQSSSKTSRVQPHDRRPAAKKTRKQASVHTEASSKPPRIGILDVIEPKAPQFLKIAARTAQQKSHRGRSSPRNKTICLGVRQDHIDASNVLNAWAHGKILPRATVRAGRRPTVSGAPTRRALEQISSNPDSTSISAELTGSVQNNKTRDPGTRSRPANASARPAQLEADLLEQPGRIAFHSKKRMLDALYRHKPRRSASPSTILVPSERDGPSPTHLEDNLSPQPEHPPRQAASRRRRKTTPARLDINTAQYRHANDPVIDGSPTPAIEILPVETELNESARGQLLRLGPYGTQYTQHFEMFPLEKGIFFHEETIIGSGNLRASLDKIYATRITQSRARVFFNLAGQPLRWGVWDDQVSSELGILCDAMVNHVTNRAELCDVDIDAEDAARFIRLYVLGAFSASDVSGTRSFISRISDVFGNFSSRLDQEVPNLSPLQFHRALRILPSLLIGVAAVVNLCRSNVALTSDVLKTEQLLQQLSKTCVSCLLGLGLDSVTSLFRDLQRPEFRQRGIRADNTVAQAWVVLMRILSHFQAPRMGFWDITYSVLIKPQVKSGVDVRAFEKLWRTVFTLLPLSEFDDSGLLAAGSRHQYPLEGWAMPQLALKRIFQLYKENSRQAPSFNNYCRAIVSRCHYLVEQWSWKKCSGVVGTIFDFFGSQNLSHLRNEEAYRSPVFLERLHMDPPLQVEPEDRCFHVFLKLVAIAIKRLTSSGSMNEVRNLVARTLPNHDRQHLKENQVHQHELSALRNHHDLLCTLYWATPSEVRPPMLIQLLEKLVVPASSHKEACLVNLRAWGQLARFIIRQESIHTFRHFLRWQSHTFQQLLDQYDSIASDINQQFLSMASDASRGISQELIKGIIASNKAATMDVLIFCMNLSLDIARLAQSLELAILAANTYQIKHIVRRFAGPQPDFPWAILHDALATLGLLLDRVERALLADRDHSDKSGLDDHIMLLDRDLTSNLFSTARGLLDYNNNQDETPLSLVSRTECTEKAVSLCGQMAAILAKCGTMRLSQCFRRGKHALFENTPVKLSLQQRKYLPLFLAAIHQRIPVDLTDIGVSKLQLWLLSIVKPIEFMCFEAQLAVALSEQHNSFIPPTAGQSLRRVDSALLRNLFEYTLSWMRRSLRSVLPAERKKMTADFSTALQAAMQSVQNDLRTLASTGQHHEAYVSFVRRVISIIRAHGGDMCKIPDFFYEVSKEYSPPVQDPQLQVASIESYGIRLAENDQRATPQLFFYMYNNFKQALLNGKLGYEVGMLREGMRTDAILGFSLGKMLPAIFRAAATRQTAFVIFDVFCEAIRLRLSQSLSPQSVGENTFSQIPRLLRSILDWAAETHQSGEMPLKGETLHLFRKMVFLLNLLGPTIEAYSFSMQKPSCWDDLEHCLGSMGELSDGAEAYLDSTTDVVSLHLSSASLFGGIPQPGDARLQDSQVSSFATSLVDDIDRNWVVTPHIITVQAPARTQSGRGSRRPVWDESLLLSSLRDELLVWNRWREKWKK